VEYWPIGRLKPYERNPRKNDKAVDRIRESIRQFGFAVPILAKSDGEVIDGHLRLKGAIAEKMLEVPVIPCDDWSDALARVARGARSALEHERHPLTAEIRDASDCRQPFRSDTC
jgi:ParB-like chromosome segregation protein Spo0J